MRLLRQAIVAVLLCWANSSPGLATEWTVVRVSGEAWIAPPNAPAARARTGMTVPDGAMFTTSGNARARLERGLESIVVGPSTVLSAETSFFSGTTVEQHAGQITLDVEKRNVKHFTVETPFLD